MMLLRFVFGSKHSELKIVFATLALLVSLPILSVVIFSTAGLSLVGETLASVNPQTRRVELFDPNGNKISEVQLSTVWPTAGYVSDEFGTWDDQRRAMRLGPHTGIDIANYAGKTGDPITPFMTGTVTKVNQSDRGDCGIYVSVQHEFNISSLYCHLVATATQEGQLVTPGDVIGFMGSSGASTGSHLHFQIAVYQIPVNPRVFVVGEPERRISE